MSNPHHFLSVPAKKAFDVPLSGPIKNYIKATFSDKEDYSVAIEGFNSLRSEALLRASYRDDCSKLLRYYDQIHAVEHKLPITENQIRIYFKWQDAFTVAAGLFGGKPKANGSWKLAYEKASVLFNIGHAYSELAVSQNISMDDQLKSAMKYFQSAAGIFSFLKDYVNTNSLSDLSADFEPGVLASMSWLMLAQAAELIHLKSASMKDDLAAKIAAHTSECYKEAYTSAKTDNAKRIVPDNFINMMFVKYLLFQSKAEYHAGKQAQTDRKYGLAVVRLDRAKDMADQAVSKSSVSAFAPALRASQDEIAKAAVAAHKDNDFVYHERLPDAKTLEAIMPQAIAKPLPVTFPLTPDFRDLFVSLVPVALTNALQSFSAKRAEIMTLEIARLREATNVLNAFLASMNLPAAIEDSGGRQIPPSVSEKANEIKRQGGIQTLEKMFNDLPVALTRNREILEETIRILDDEERGDVELRTQFRERWTRTPSTSLTAPLRTEAKKFTDIIQNAANADKIVHDKYQANRDAMILLSKQAHEIANELPSASAAGALRDSYVVKELHRLMDEVAGTKAEREVIEAELKNTDSDSVRARLIAAFQQGNHNDENSVVVHEIESIYTPLRQQVNSTLSRQEQLVENIRRANQQFQNEKQGNVSSELREEMLKKLARAYDAFQELRNNLREGNKFYTDLTPLLLKFQNKVSDFVFARKTEKEDLMKDIQRNILGGNQPSSSSSSHHNASSGYPPSSSSQYPPSGSSQYPPSSSSGYPPSGSSQYPPSSSSQYPPSGSSQYPPSGSSQYPPSSSSQYPPSGSSQYPHPYHPSTSGQQPPTVPDASGLPYPGAHTQPFFPLPAGYNPYYNPAAPPYPMGGAPPYPHQGYGVDRPQPGSGNKKH